jgi:hypothetical protein
MKIDRSNVDGTHVHLDTTLSNDCFTLFLGIATGVSCTVVVMMIAFFIVWMQLPPQARIMISSAVHETFVNTTYFIKPPVNATEFIEALANATEFDDFVNVVINRPRGDDAIRLNLVDVWEHKWKGLNEEFDTAMNHFIRLQDGTCEHYGFISFGDLKYCGPHSIFDVLITRSPTCWKVFRRHLTAKELCWFEEKYPVLLDIFS